jgi:hypothetical protein
MGAVPALSAAVAAPGAERPAIQAASFGSTTWRSEEAQEIALLDPDWRVCAGAELRGLQLAGRDVAANGVGADPQSHRRFAYREQPLTPAIVSMCKRIIAGAGDDRPRYAPRSGGDGKEPPQGNRPSSRRSSGGGSLYSVRVPARPGAALRSLTVPCNAGGAWRSLAKPWRGTDRRYAHRPRRGSLTGPTHPSPGCNAPSPSALAALRGGSLLTGC